MQQQIRGCCRGAPKKCGRGTPLISNSPKYRQYLAAKAAREIVQRLLTDGDRLGGYCRLSRRMNHMLSTPRPSTWGQGNEGCGAGLRLFSRQYSLLTEAQKMDCDLRARSCCSRCAGRCRDDHRRTMQKIPYPFQRPIRTFWKQSAKNILSARTLEAMRVCQPPFRCWTW